MNFRIGDTAIYTKYGGGCLAILGEKYKILSITSNTLVMLGDLNNKPILSGYCTISQLTPTTSEWFKEI